MKALVSASSGVAPTEGLRRQSARPDAHSNILFPFMLIAAVKIHTRSSIFGGVRVSGLNLTPHKMPYEGRKTDDVVWAVQSAAEWQEERDVSRVDGRVGETQDLKIVPELMAYDDAVLQPGSDR